MYLHLFMQEFATCHLFSEISQLVIFDRKHYSVSSAELTFGGKGVGIKNLDVIFDSGSSYSYLNSQAYRAIISLV